MGRGLTVSSNAMPKTFTVPAHDLDDSPSAYQSWLSTPRPEAIYSLTSAIEILQ